MTATAACPFSNPQSLFTDLKHQRAKSSIEYSPVLNAYVVTRYNDILSILSNPETFTSKDATIPPFPGPVKSLFANRVPEGGTLLGWDNPDHDRLRASVSGFFIPRKLERFRPLMSALAHELVDGFVERGQVEIKSAFALPLPLKLIVAIAGLDASRWEWIGRCLALFGGITAAEGETSIETQVQDVLDLHDYVAEVIQERKYDRRDDLISYIWDQRDSGVVQMTDFEHLSMIPGLLLAGHETTTSVLSMGLSHLLHNNIWDAATENETATAQAIEELLRYESAITGMFRLVKKETVIGSCTLNPGDQVFLAYSSGSRDESVFECPGKLQLQRRFSKQHLGFGRGIHACLGAPLARLLLKTEFSILRERLPKLRLVTPYEEIRYEKVGPSRGIERVVVAWDPPKGPWARAIQVQKTKPQNQNTRVVKDTIQTVVKRLLFLTDEILEVTLCSKSMSPFPCWEPGAHIDMLSDHGYRQYSLCSDPEDRSHWKVAILREDTGSGGSIWFHENLREGAEITVRKPRNHFRLKKRQRYVFIAGGIGITPIKPMLAQAKHQRASSRLIYLGRSRKTMAYLNELSHDHPVDIWARDEGNRFDLEGFARAQDEAIQVYCCGPERLLSSLEEACKPNPLIELSVERFQASSSQAFLPNRPFDVVLDRSGRTVTVPAEQTLLDALNANGCGIMSTCSKGTCGTCEVSVLEGVLEHRDTILSQEEKGENRVMMPCVSRSVGERLVLDLW